MTPAAERKHWTEAQYWEARKSHDIVTAGELLKRYRSELRGVSLCCATFEVACGGDTWFRLGSGLSAQEGER